MKSKIALVLCITQLCMLHSVEAATQRRVKTKVAQKSTLFKKIGSAVVIAAVGSAIAIIHKRAEQEEIQHKESTVASSQGKYRLSLYKFYPDNTNCYLGADLYFCGTDTNALMQKVDLDPWRQALGLHPSEDPSPVLLDKYRNRVATDNLSLFIFRDITIKENLSQAEATQLQSVLNQTCQYFDPGRNGMTTAFAISSFLQQN